MSNTGPDKMRHTFRIVPVLVFAAVGIISIAQQVPSTPSPDAGQSDSAPQQRHMDSPATAEAARSFNGTIIRARAQFVLKQITTHTLYGLDDQKKAKRYEGKRVMVTATMDSTSNTLHVIDIVDFNRESHPKFKK
jgi:hypothetical protein